jgi:uncharacterized protein YfaS (alpha-2-macroglobulin family)
MQKSLLMLFLFGIGFSSVQAQNNYLNQWNDVESFVRQGLPQSALKIVDSIYSDAKTANNAPQFLKAVLYQIKLRADYQEDYMESSIKQIDQEIASSQTPIAEILHSMQAELYWRYYQGNRFKFMDRTKVINPDPNDIKTWDLTALIKAVNENYLASLADAGQSQQIKLDKFDPILETEKGSKIFRPTLFDFLAHRALEYFMNEEPAVIKPAAGFYIDKEEFFAPSAEFVAFKMDTTGKDDLKWQAMAVFQELVSFHLNDAEPAALIDVDLLRIKYAGQHSVLPNHYDLYLKALQNLQNTHPTDPHSAAVAYEIALEYNRRGGEYNPTISDTNRWAIKSAKEICEKTINSYPGSDGAENCLVLLSQITQQSMALTVNYANLPELPFLSSLSFKNIKTVYFRVISINPDDDRDFRQQNRSEAIIGKYKSIKPLKEWSLKLPDEGDFQSHNTQIKLPALPKGYYVIYFSDSQDFSAKDQTVAYTSFWITSLSYISESNNKAGTLEFFVLDRVNGHSLKGVEIQAFAREYNYQSRAYINKPVASYLSDEEGSFSITSPATASKSFYLEFKLGDDRFFTENYFYLYPPPQEEKTKVNTYFFTDRSIYRPGQTIYFKGIVLETSGAKTEIKPDFTSVVTFYDVNNQKVSELAMTTNDFGSFNGTFAAPTGGLTGEMTIRNESGSTSFAIEEYKRPRFKVDIDPLEGNYKLNEEVNVTGKAMNYNGSAVDKAVVTYRVVRTARFPVWRGWWSWFPAVPETEITNGKTITATDGSFKVSFKAIPDLGVEKKFTPVFNYSVYIDVADITGEVHSAEESISIGYQSLLIDLDIPEKLDISQDKPFKLTVTNLNKQPVNTDVRITVYPLESPSRLIRERSWARPDVFIITKDEFTKEFPYELYDNENDPSTWKKKPILSDKTLNSGKDSVFTIENQKWSEGEYLLVLEATDAFGEKVKVEKYFTAFKPAIEQMPSNRPFWHVMLKNSGEPGDTASFIVGSSEKGVKLIYEIENDGKMISREWLDLSQSKTKLSVPIKEEYRGNFFIHLAFVKGNHSYGQTEQVTVPYTDKELKITTETFRNKLIPGQKEEWRLKITGFKGDKVAAELLASMYDASLDAFREHQWIFDLYPIHNSSGGWNVTEAFIQATSNQVSGKPRIDKAPVIQSYDRLNWFGFNYYGGPYGRYIGGMQTRAAAMPEMDGKANSLVEKESNPASGGGMIKEPEKAPVKAPEMPIRRNFAETAFFFPALRTDENGDVILKFTVPESLTAWKMMALAYTKDLKVGQLQKEIVTRKDLMVMTNAPRFFREDDQVVFTAKVVSMAEKTIEGQVQAEFFDAYTMKPIDTLLGNKDKAREFSISKGNSGVFQWEISIPDGVEAIVCRVKATSEEMGDGEEVVVPVLSNRMLVTETLPLPISGKGTENFKFDKLIESSKSKTIKNYRLTLEFTSNPAWYAVQALPYLVEDPLESSDGLFSRYYANKLASYIANSNPEIRQVFENWKNLTPDALLSNLEKNQELKAVLLNETPWVMEARNETERKKRLALLFDLNRMADEQQSSLKKLQQMQASNGGWAWFEGMPDNRYITQLIVTGFGKLQHLNVIDLKRQPDLINMLQRAFAYLDARIKEDYDEIIEHDKDHLNENHLSCTQVQYLYAYSYLKDYVEVKPQSREAFDYFKGQAVKYWLDQNKYIQAMIAISLYRMGDEVTPVAILNSLKENALYDDEMGMYWRDPEGYYWQEAPVERQAMMIEAFSEVTNDQEAVNDMKMWLLKQKQTQDWKTSRATADAVYALLLRGVDQLASDQLVEVTMGEEKIDPLALDGVEVQAGTGYFEVSKTSGEIMPEMGEVKVVKKDEGIAWGSVYWQYFENLDKIIPAKTPLSLERELYVEKNTASGPVLEPVFDNSILRTGDKVKVRITIRVDRDMEYIHMKDMRAAAFEPVDVLSGYRYQGGLGYFESIKDASINFYFDYLRKGTYVFEYPLNVTQKGEFSNGITTIQCLYAPEFSAHSQGMRVTIE